MGILINLLPDLRQAKLREQRRRQIAIVTAVSVWVFCGVVVLGMFLYSAGQTYNIGQRNKSIAATTKKLTQVPNLLEALTAQQHLNSIGSLYQNRVLFSKFFEAYQASSPVDVSISSLKVDSGNVLSVDGVAKTYAAVSKLQRALEQSNVTVGLNAAVGNSPYFTKVNITGTTNTAGKGVEFNINANVSPEVLDAK